jgi:hypothetical protein
MKPADKPSTGQTSPLNREAVIADVRRIFLDRVEFAVRAAGVDAPASIESLRTGAILLLDQMTTEGVRTGFALANSLTASQIRLVDDNQLELSIRLGDISKRLRDECANALYKFHQRFVTLLDRPALRVADDPLSPEAICRALADMFGSGDHSHLQAVARLAEIEGQLVRELPLLYTELTELLVRHNIAPAKPQGAASEPQVQRYNRRSADRDSDAMAALQQAVLSRMQASAPAGAGQPVAANDGAPRFEQVMGQLDHWQTEAQPDLFGGAPQQVAQSALHTLKTSEAMARLRAQDAVALDVLSALFDALFEDDHLSPSVKAAIARLQIPILKAAILGPTFFTDPEHPARALLQQMGQATTGLGADVDADHPVCTELQRIAARVQAEYQRDPEVFARYGAELESFMARRHHELQGNAQDFIALAKVQEERDVAARAAWRLIASKTLSVHSRIIADFLREHWTKVLAADWLDGGQFGANWQKDERVLDDLLWSIQPKADPEERKQLGQLVPDLLARIRAGLDSVGISAEVRAPFLEACFSLQAAAIRGRAMQAQTPTASAAEPVEVDQLVELTSDDVTLKSLRTTNPDARASGEAVLELVIGDWVEFQMPDSSLRCGRLCWISPELGNPLFMNPGWDCAISISRTILERQFAAAVASTGSTLSFFDNAIEKALHKSTPGKV